MAKLNIRNRNRNKYDKDGKPKAPNWEYRFEAAKIEGKRKSISKAGFRTKKEAEIAGAKAMAEYDNAGLKFEPTEISFADYLDFWMDNHVRVNLKYNTQGAYGRIIENHVKPSLGAYKLRALTPAVIQEFINKKNMQGYTRSHMKGMLTLLSGALKYAVHPAQMIQTNPAAYVKLPKTVAAKKDTNRVIISVEDFNRMLERFEKGNPFRYALMIGFYTGMRIGEVHALTWDDIDLEAGTIVVNKTAYKRGVNKDQNRSVWTLGSAKSAASHRKIKIGQALVRSLKEYRRVQAENRLNYGEFYTQTYTRETVDEKGHTITTIIELEQGIPVTLPRADLVMRKENGQYSSTDSFKYAARVIHYELGIDFNFHSLRHTHATMLIESGVSPKAVQARLGHDMIETTLQTYVHNTEAMEDEAVDVFESSVSTTS